MTRSFRAIENLTRSREGICEDCTHLDSPATIDRVRGTKASFLSSNEVVCVCAYWLKIFAVLDRISWYLHLDAVFFINFVVVLTAQELTAVTRTGGLLPPAESILTVRDITYTASCQFLA